MSADNVASWSVVFIDYKDGITGRGGTARGDGPVKWRSDRSAHVEIK